ncbi:hypothetical protein E2R33_09670 [Rathayibacter toxicus]|nr:hypothetical protein C5D35_02100 [Rathayibacter toxicus]QWL28838.1 hypothetical protein E2R33_09670 [Rathayibacter toxicus]QWL30944.1 hypothetical protein E2R34_09460 [Rathayibacter toxicus]
MSSDILLSNGRYSRLRHTTRTLMFPPNTIRSRIIMRALATSAILTALAVAVPSGAASAAAPSTLSVLSLGDSTTRAFATCGSYADCPVNSWSTGSSPAVNSFASRLQASQPNTRVTTANFALSGSVAAQVSGRVDDAVRAGVQPNVITLLTGGNNLCSPSIPADDNGYPMTPAATFANEAAAAISKIRKTWPSAQIELSSVPNSDSQWESVRNTPYAQRWADANLCRATRGVSATGKPLSPTEAAATTAAENRRRDEYNAILQRTCAADGPLCHWDGGALSRLNFTPDLLSTVDHFHPNIAGQAAIAEVEWNASSFGTRR